MHELVVASFEGDESHGQLMTELEPRVPPKVGKTFALFLGHVVTVGDVDGCYCAVPTE
jgi:hypothetical protein